jgi:transposase
LLISAAFDGFVEDLCASHYAAVRGRPSVPPGRYFRMLLIGYFEGIDSERGLEWRCHYAHAASSFEPSGGSL